MRRQQDNDDERGKRIELSYKKRKRSGGPQRPDSDSEASGVLVAGAFDY